MLLADKIDTVASRPEPGFTGLTYPLEGGARPRDRKDIPPMLDFLKGLENEAEYVFEQKFKTKADFNSYVGKTIPVTYAGIRFHITVHTDISKSSAGIRPSDMQTDVYKEHKEDIDGVAPGILRTILAAYYKRLP